MIRLPLIIILLVFNACSSIKNSNIHNIEVSNHISNHIAEINVNINKPNIVINLQNASSAEQIKLYLNFLQQLEVQNITIQCMSQCKIELLGNFGHAIIQNLFLKNVHLIQNTELKVQNLSIISAEAIKTGLPIVLNKAEINITASENMLKTQKLLTSINIIPGSGEFVYDPKIVYNANGKPINSNNAQNISDATYNLNNLKETLPNLKWTAPVVSWFGINTKINDYNLDVSNIAILPGVDKREEDSEIWYVGDYNRKTAYITSKDENNRANYGGTINDSSILRYIDALKSENLKIMFYPMIAMDFPNKPWRGFIKADNPKDISNFFNKKDGYNNFILHYATLLKNKVDAFVIGSEMQELTQTIDPSFAYPNPARYPAVVELIKLAKEVKKILGPKVIVTYAANWGEYHHDKNEFYHLDPLWASEDIDVVGIDAYLPITNKSMGDITIEEIKKGWESGELWDYYYKNNNRQASTPELGLKRIEYWWKNEHWKENIKSAWRPKMKPIWFTEFGFPSMNMATNSPNVFWNPKSSSGNIPKKSSGRPDFAIQMRAIRGTLEYWQSKKEVVAQLFLWAWDARPYPYYPNRVDIWSDGELWSRGHWINGKITALKQVRLLPNFQVNLLKTNADELIIEGVSRPKELIAKTVVYLP